MKRLLFVTSFLVLFVFLTITNVQAKECTTTELRTLKELAKKVTISYEPKQDIENNYYFAVNAYNMDKKFYLIINDATYVMYSSNNMLIGGYAMGTSVKVSVYASDATNCKDELVTYSTYKMPTYNKYYESDDCKGKEDKDVCKKWYDTSKITQEKFKELVNKNDTTKKEKQTFLDNALSIIKQYGLIALGGVAGVGLVVFAVIYIKNKKRTKIDL